MIMLHLQKSSPRMLEDHEHPSAVWAIVEAPGLVIAREWMPEAAHSDWIVLFEYFRSMDNRMPWVESLSQLETWNEHDAKSVYSHLCGQRFRTRLEALQAVAMVLETEFEIR